MLYVESVSLRQRRHSAKRSRLTLKSVKGYSSLPLLYVLFHQIFNVDSVRWREGMLCCNDCMHSREHSTAEQSIFIINYTYACVCVCSCVCVCVCCVRCVCNCVCVVWWKFHSVPLGAGGLCTVCSIVQCLPTCFYDALYPNIINPS